MFKLECSSAMAAKGSRCFLKQQLQHATYNQLCRSHGFSCMQIWQLDLVTFQWNQVACKGTVPPFRVHCSSAVVENRWILHGGRIPAPSTQFNVQNQSYVLNLTTWR